MNILATQKLVQYVVLLCVTIAGSVSAEQYYVSKSGSNSNGGTSLAQSWLTIQHAAQNAKAGDTVWVDEGVYTEPDPVSPSTEWWGIRPKYSGTESQPITYQALEGKTVVIDQNDQAPCITLYGVEYVVIKGFELRNCVYAGVWIQSGSMARNFGISVVGNHIHDVDGPSGTNVGGVRADRVGEAFIANNLIHDIRVGGSMSKENGAGVHSYRMWDTRVENNEIYNAANGVYFKLPDDESRGGVSISKNLIYDTVLDAIQLNTNDTAPGHHLNTVISQNIVKNCGGFYDDDTYQSAVQADGLKIFNNTVINSGGIEIRGHKNVEVYNNILYGVSASVVKGLDTAQSPAFRTIYSSVVFSDPDKRHAPSITYLNYNIAYPKFTVQTGLYYSAEEKVFQNLAEWRQALASQSFRGFDMPDPTKVEQNSFEADPLFYSGAQSNFRLLPASPVRVKGRNGVDFGAYMNKNDAIGITNKLAPCPPMSGSTCEVE